MYHAEGWGGVSSRLYDYLGDHLSCSFGGAKAGDSIFSEGEVSLYRSRQSDLQKFTGCFKRRNNMTQLYTENGENNYMLISLD